MKHENRAIKIKLSLHNKVHLKQKSIICDYVICNVLVDQKTIENCRKKHTAKHILPL